MRRPTESHDPAFPFTTSSKICNGLTKREYFAAMAMQGWLASFSTVDDPNVEMITRFSVRVADTLIDKLNEEDN